MSGASPSGQCSSVRPPRRALPSSAIPHPDPGLRRSATRRSRDRVARCPNTGIKRAELRLGDGDRRPGAPTSPEGECRRRRRTCARPRASCWLGRRAGSLSRRAGPISSVASTNQNSASDGPVVTSPVCSRRPRTVDDLSLAIGHDQGVQFGRLEGQQLPVERPAVKTAKASSRWAPRRAAAAPRVARTRLHDRSLRRGADRLPARGRPRAHGRGTTDRPRPSSGSSRRPTRSAHSDD